MATSWYLMRDSSSIERFVKLLEGFSAATLSMGKQLKEGSAVKDLSIVKHKYRKQ